jgi:hypothetical protein
VKQANEDENELNQNPPQPDEITEQKNLLKSTSNNNDERTARYETHISQFLIISSISFRTNSYRSAKKVDSNGRPVKGRGFMVSRLIFFFLSLMSFFRLEIHRKESIEISNSSSLAFGS